MQFSSLCIAKENCQAQIHLPTVVECIEHLVRAHVRCFCIEEQLEQSAACRGLKTRFYRQGLLPDQ